MAWDGSSYLRAARDLPRAHNLALGIARVTGQPAHVIVHARGLGGTLLVASSCPAGSGLPVISRRMVKPDDAPMPEPQEEGDAPCSSV